MNFDDAVTAHTKWKIRLRAVIDGQGEKLDSAVVAKDDQCDLGRWIHGAGATNKHHDSYRKLKDAHARFHQCASKVVTLANQGKKTEAETLMGATGEFAKLSSETITAIRVMKREAG